MVYKRIPMIVALFLVTTGSLFGAEAKDCSFRAVAQLTEHGRVLTVEVEECKEVRNACDLVVQSFEYLPALNTVSIRLQNQPCFVDRIGRQKGRFYWELPRALRGEAKLCLLANQQRVGTVYLNQGKAKFKSNTEEVCF